MKKTTLNPDNTDYDIIVVGGGLAGVSLAWALRDQNLRIAIIESAVFKTGSQPNYDDRGIALSYGTRRIFEGMGIWSQLEKLVTPIHKIHVSDRGHFGVTRIDKQEENVDALGYVITARNLGNTLVDAVNTCKHVDIISPATVQGLDILPESAVVSLSCPPPEKTSDDQTTPATTPTKTPTKNISAKLVIAADGGRSSIRDMLNIGATETDYKQSAIIANVSCERHHQHVAYERFTNEGPLALLPLTNGKKNSNERDNRCALVWTRPDKQTDETMSLSDEEFLAQLQKRFGQRLGYFTKVGKRAAHPLHMIRSKEQVRHRVAIIGNAAHTLHPIAGQGFNLGLRDVSTLAQVIVDATQLQQDPGSLSVLQEYAQWRKQDHQRISGFTDKLVRIFSNAFPPLAGLRNAGLIATDILPPIKHLLAKHSMGTAGKLPRLARGLPL